MGKHGQYVKYSKALFVPAVCTPHNHGQGLGSFRLWGPKNGVIGVLQGSALVLNFAWPLGNLSSTHPPCSSRRLP